MTKFIKRLLLKVLFNAKEREVIFKSLMYSEARYKKKGNYEKAVTVAIVFHDLAPLFCGCKSVYTHREVHNIIDSTIHRTFKLAEAGFNAALKKMGVECEIVPGAEFKSEKCEACDNRNECEIAKHVFGDQSHEATAGNDGQDANPPATPEAPEEAKAEGTEQGE